ncbi:hypothetical protein ACOI1C_10750 [Bacillus sp. DJP31]|uniref:hypothetical protein n=1 Tax=Bacillus sp. DJP31 TaxID=3409789 RepID=UPI003BB6FBE7
MRRKKGIRQKIKIYGFKFPQALLEDMRNFQVENNIQIPASAHAAMIAILKQIHREKTTKGEVHEFNLPAYASECKMAYSTLYVGFKFWLRHGFIQETINSAGMSIYILRNYKQYFETETGEDLNYFIVPHSLFETNMIAELVRTSNSKAFELMLSLLTQFRHGVATIDHTDKIEKIKQLRNMSTLKVQLGKRSKGVREVLEMLEPLFHIQYVGLQHRGLQVWIHQVQFSLKSDCVIENSDAFEVSPLVSEFSKQTDFVLTDLNINYKPRDLFDIMISFKQEVINVLKYVTKNEGENTNYSARDGWIESYFYSCLRRFQSKIQDQIKPNQAFQFSKSIGAYFRTVFRNNLKTFIEKEIPTDYIREANMKEFLITGELPELHQLLTKY